MASNNESSGCLSYLIIAIVGLALIVLVAYAAVVVTMLLYMLLAFISAIVLSIIAFTYERRNFIMNRQIKIKSIEHRYNEVEKKIRKINDSKSSLAETDLSILEDLKKKEAKKLENLQEKKNNLAIAILNEYEDQKSKHISSRKSLVKKKIKNETDKLDKKLYENDRLIDELDKKIQHIYLTYNVKPDEESKRFKRKYPITYGIWDSLNGIFGK